MEKVFPCISTGKRQKKRSQPFLPSAGDDILLFYMLQPIAHWRQVFLPHNSHSSESEQLWPFQPWQPVVRSPSLRLPAFRATSLAQTTSMLKSCDQHACRGARLPTFPFTHQISQQELQTSLILV